MNWQPIETAPIADEGNFLVERGDSRNNSWIEEVFAFEGNIYPQRLLHGIHFDDRVQDAKRWMPLPADAPTQEGPLQVWFGSMPESCGRTNWTAVLHRGSIGDGYTFARSEFPGRVRYEADRVRHLVGELKERPHILAYDGDEKTPCHLCGGSGVKDGKPCHGLKFTGTIHIEATEPATDQVGECYSTNNEEFNFEELHDALDSLDGSGELEVGRKLWRGVCVKKPAAYYFDLDSMLEDMGARAYDDGGEYSEDFPELTPEEKKELDALIGRWLDKHVPVRFWSVTSSEAIEVTQEMVDEFRGKQA